MRPEISVKELVDTAIKIVSFGVDRHGELYLLDQAGGLYRLVADPNQAASEPFPRRLSETEIFESLRPLVLPRAWSNTESRQT